MKLKLNEAKNLEFEMDASGVSEKDLKGYLRFAFEDIEYGFPVKFEEGKVSVSIPPFESFLSRQVNESISQHKEVSVKGRLDIIANNVYMTPWSDTVEIEVPVSVKVEEAGRSSKKNTSIKVLDPEVKEMMEDLDVGKGSGNEKIEKQQINEKKKSKMKEFFSNVKVDREEEDDLEENEEITEEENLEEEKEFDKKISKFKKLFEAEE